MQAAYLTGIRQFEIRDIPMPEINNAGDVLLRIDEVGVCGSDMHYYSTGRIGNEQVVEFPWIVGHECAATVEQVGGEVENLIPGQRVAVDPLVTCGQCDQCLANRPHTCRNQMFLGCPCQLPGAMVEYLVMPAECCLPVPDSMSGKQTVLTEPFAIALWACHLAGDLNGASVGILGSGPIGLCVLAAAKSTGAKRCYVTDLIDERLEMASRQGAGWAGCPEKQDIVADILKDNPKGLDFVFECAGEQETVDQAAGLLAPGGMLLLLGIPEFDKWSLPTHGMRRKELSVRNVRRQNGMTSEAIRMVADRDVVLDSLVTHHFSLDKSKEAFDLVADYHDGVVKAIIHIGQ